MAEASQNTLTLQGQLIRFEGNPFETEDALRYERDGQQRDRKSVV